MFGIADGTPVWLDQLDGRERASLTPGIPGRLDRRPDVLVIGGGVQGLAAAAACRELGLGRVVLIERDRLGAGPSGSAAGVLCPEAHLDAEGSAFVDFARASLQRHEALAVEVEPRLRLRRLDWLLLEPHRAIAGLAGQPGVERLDPDEVRRLAPGLGTEAAGLLLRGAQAHVNPLRLVSVLASRAGMVATGVEYVGLRVRGGRVEAVSTSHGDFQAGAVVFATGLAPRELLPLGQQRIKGHLAATEPARAALPASLSAPGASVWQLEDGRLLTGGDQVPDDGSPQVDGAAIDRFRTELTRLLPASAGLRLTHAWSCARPATSDRLPVIDRAPGLENVWLTAGHYTTGVLLAPATGHVLASWIASGAAPASSALFRIDRPSEAYPPP